ncbi:transglutaminase family protein [Synechococcus sp. CB0101]|uniref:transglutaminase family protein n=1 Tax=Synechococcus sp. CB0101 TaxID=232348 RepID=UPI0002E743C1|nr:transglutaminase family protein [Synechococcus sp. CB0101]
MNAVNHVPESNAATASAVEARLQQAGIQLTMGGEPTLVPIEPQGAEWSVAADGPTKLRYARQLAAELQRRAWPGSTLLYCPGKQYDGEVNPRWALRLITGQNGEPLVPITPSGDYIPSPAELHSLIESVGRDLSCTLQALPLRDPLQHDRQVWAIPLSCTEGQWRSVDWPLQEELRELSGAPGPAGLRLPLQHFPSGELRQVLTLERDPHGWALFLPPLEREPLEVLLQRLAAHSPGWKEPELSGVLPWDAYAHWQVLGLTADPGVLEVNLPVCHTWHDYAGWIQLLDEAGAAVGLRSWKQQGSRTEGTGGGNHLLLGGPSLEAHPFFHRPAWLVGLLRYWQHHPCLAYLFSGRSVGPASQAPRPDEGSASRLDLELAHRALEQLPPGDQRVAIGETLRHLHADRSGNTHRSEISLDKFWNPAWTAGCQGLLEFRALESLPDHRWTNAVALLFRALAVRQLNPEHRPKGLRTWGDDLHDRAMLPSALWADLEQVLADLAAYGLPLDPEPLRAIWQWRFPALLQWQAGEAELCIRQALEPWPLLCDTPVEGGSTSRFVDSSLRRFELIANPSFRRSYTLAIQGRPLVWPRDPEQPIAVRFRQEALFPCLHPCLPVDVPLQLDVLAADSGEPVAHWRLRDESSGFELLTEGTAMAKTPAPLAHGSATPLRGAGEHCSTVDLRL